MHSHESVQFSHHVDVNYIFTFVHIFFSRGESMKTEGYIPLYPILIVIKDILEAWFIIQPFF
jgi:hypothetical protein